MPRLLTLCFCLLGTAATAQEIDCANAMAQMELNQCA